ncbi:MAG: hypothetical protein H6733_13000 [Alphaproteobacteria bacterium]|nr:hypothetical protein [Alphaproteobacteria bacterium]
MRPWTATRWTTPGLLVLLGACGTATTDVAVDDGPEACGSDDRVVSFLTSDRVQLVADWWPAASADAPVLVLFHMNPVSFDRTGYPPRVRKALHDEGWAVLNVDRRGAGDSAGKAEDATTGPGALADAEAAVRFALDPARTCAVDRDRLVIVGASNGTTPTYDYQVARDSDLPAAAALVFLSPGAYTESNHTMARDTWPDGSFPLLWLYPTTEPYSTGFVADAPGVWSFVERGDQHGTRMFDKGTLESQTLSDLTGFVHGVVDAGG